MTIHRTAAKRDTNEAEIIAALRAAGASVQPLSIKGGPDLLVGYHGGNLLLEVKQREAKLTPDELVWHELWAGQVAIVRSVEDALEQLRRVTINYWVEQYSQVTPEMWARYTDWAKKRDG